MKSFQQSDALQRLPEQFFAKLVHKVTQLNKEYDDVINLGQGNPDQPTPKPIIAELQAAAENPLYHKYPPFEGYAFLKRAIADYYEQQYGVTLDPKTEVAIVSGTKTGLVEISQCFLNYGDVASSQTPATRTTGPALPWQVE